MSVGCFTEKKHHPTEEEIQAAIGEWQGEWLALVQFLRQRYADSETWKFMYGKRYGWALQLMAGRKLVTNLYPTQGGFTVQVNLSEAAVQTAFQTDLSPQVRQAMEAATVFPEGRWMFIPVQSARDIENIRRLLILRMETRFR